MTHYSDSLTRRVGESPTPRLAELASQGVSDSPTFLLNIQKPTPRLAESESRRLTDSPSRGVVFGLRISLEIRSQNWNGSKGSARDLWGPIFCKNPRKSASLPCPFKANLSEYGSYLHHIHMFRYIWKHHLFASFPSYSLQNIRTDSYTNIRFDAKKYIWQRIFASEQIFPYDFLLLANTVFASKYSFRSEYSQNFKQISHSS